MGRLSMKNVTEKPPGSGNLYFRRKVKGKDTYQRLPDPLDPDFAGEYERLSRKTEKKPGHAHGTLGALVVSYRSSDLWKAKDIKTRANQGRMLDRVEAEHGHRSVKGVRPIHVLKMLEAFEGRPGNGVIYLSVFKTLMKFSIILGWRDDNPAQEITGPQIGEHEPWPAELLEVCLKESTPMTRLAIISGLCSGQRIGDVARMQYGWISDSIMSFTQQKRRKGGVRKFVAFPMHPLWLDELGKMERRAVTLLYDRSGKPFKDGGAIRDRMQDLMAKPAVKKVIADLVAREAVKAGQFFSFHGLRKNACCYLLEMKLNDSEVGSMLGMSAEMVRHYGKRTRALTIARGAAEKATGGKIFNLPGVKSK